MNLGQQAFGAVQNQAEALNRIIENISNINSIGYKKTEVNFLQTLDGQMKASTAKEFSQGPLRRTGDVLDLALEGQGFFEVEFPNGQRAYTRAGRFRQNSDGELVTEEGYRVIPQIEQSENTSRSVIERKPIVNVDGAGTLAANELGLNLKVVEPKLTIPTTLTPEIGEDGSILGVDNSGEKSKIGKLNVVVFNNPNGLEATGKGYYVPTKASGAPLDTEIGSNASTKVKQGYLEFGNVNMASEFMNLTQIKDLLSAQFKVLKAVDKIYENINYTIGRSA